MKFFLLALALSSPLFLLAQDVEYKKGIITVNGAEYAKLEVIKQNFGLTKNFEVYNNAGKKIIIAAVATEFDQDKDDNSTLYYRVTFLTSNQVGIFKVPALSQEKGFAKLIGASNILVNNETDDKRVADFIAMKGASPKIAVNYTLVNRNKSWPITLQKDRNIEQNSQIIGNFTNRGFYNNVDSYEFALPTGVTVAKISFAGGNNMQNMEVFTAKDNVKRVVPMATNDKLLVADASIDKNQFALKRVVKWLVDNNYL